MRKLIAGLLSAMAGRIAPLPTPPLPSSEGLTHQRSDDFVAVTSTLMHCNPSPIDFQLSFGEFARRKDQLVALWSAGVTMGWPHTKLLCLFLASNVYDHEQAYGPITICPAIRPNFLPESAASLSLKQIAELTLRPAEPPASTSPSTIQ